MGLLQSSIAWARRNTPTREEFERIRWLRPIAHRILRPELWRFTRRSVPRGVALGWLVGVLIPVAQTVFAALFSLPVRANVPVAALTTFLTNPLTTPPLWYFAYRIGNWILHLDRQIDGAPIAEGVNSEAVGWIRWLFDVAGPATLLGLVVIAVVGAVIGYVVSAFGWKWWIAHKWRHHRGRR